MSTRTPNINLEKPSSDENYSIAVFNGNSDTIDTEMALRVKTADIVNNLTTTVTNKPLSAAQGKALNDAKVNISDIQNNLTSTATNKPLSAAQGKALSDTIVAESNKTAYNTVVCTTKAQVQSAVWDFCNQTNNKQTHIIIINSAKDDVFTSFMNYSIVDVILTESNNVWANHPSFFMYDAQGDACTGQLSVTSTTMAVSGDPWKKFVKEGSYTNVSNLISWDTTNCVASVTSCIAIKMANRVSLSAVLKMKTGVNLQGAFIGTLGQGIQASTLSNLNAKFTKSDSQYANEIADVYLLNSTTIRISNDKTNATNLNGALSDNSLTIIGEWYTDQ